jgi:hypothetical protein
MVLDVAMALLRNPVYMLGLYYLVRYLLRIFQFSKGLGAQEEVGSTMASSAGGSYGSGEPLEESEF